MNARADFIDRPFAPALETVVDLPFPPSTNAIWRSGRGRVHKSDKYKAWQADADVLTMSTGQLRGARRLSGHFTAEIILGADKRRANSDADNRVKGLLDWAQSRQLIKNDSLLDHLTVYWGHAPQGARLILRSVIE